MDIKVKPIGFVRSSRIELTDDFWGEVISEIELTEEIGAEAFDHITAFSHLEIIYHFHNAIADVKLSNHPRENPNYPKMGIFAQRKKDRPNHIGLTTVELISHEENTIKVRNLDAIDGTPILDIKPVMKEFLPKSDIKQPDWVADLMKNYW